MADHESQPDTTVEDDTSEPAGSADAADPVDPAESDGTAPVDPAVEAIPTPAQLAIGTAAGSDHAPRSVLPAGGDPARWGRVDNDGTVYLRTADGERHVGSWQAGEPAEGLAHFARRFDDLLTETELLAARLASGTGDTKQTLTSARHLRDGLVEAAVVGDVAGLATRLDGLVARAEAALDEARTARAAARAAATARKELLAAEAEQLADEATQWKQAGDRFKAILDEWKTLRGMDRKTDELLWKRFAHARDAFNRRRGTHFAELDRQRAAAKTRKEELAAEAEQLLESADWPATAVRYRQLMIDWKAAGRAPKDVDDALWQRFRAAQDAFFARRSAVASERDNELSDAARQKEELITEAERIDTTDLEGARGALRGVQERWDAAGAAPRERQRELDARLRAVEERIRSAADRQWRRVDPEAEARVAQFRDRLAQFEARAVKARAAGDERRATQAEQQAMQWREWLATAERAVQGR